MGSYKDDVLAATMAERKKYVLLKNESIVVNEVTLYRIEAIISFCTQLGKVHVGDKGGYVESEENLSHSGCCWIWDDAKVCGGANVQNDAQVCGKARVFDSATVRNDAIVRGRAIVHGKRCSVYNAAEVCEDAMIWSSNISERSVVKGYSFVQDSSVYGSSEILGNSIIKKCSIYWSTLNSVDLNNCVGIRYSYITEAQITNAVELNHAVIQCTNDLMIVGPIGSRSAYTEFFIGRKHPGANLQIMVRCGCFIGAIDEFEKAVKVKYTEKDDIHYITYMDAIQMANHKLGRMLSLHKANEQSPLSEDLDGDFKVLISRWSPFGFKMREIESDEDELTEEIDEENTED